MQKSEYKMLKNTNKKCKKTKEKQNKQKYFKNYILILKLN